jgi:hypothetical protein
MNFKTTYLLFGGLAAVLGIVLLVQLFGRKGVDATNYALPTMHKPSAIRTADIDRVEIDRHRDETGTAKEEKLVLERQKDGWRLKNPQVRLDSLVVDRLIDQVRDAAKEENADVRGDLRQFGLESPAATVTLHHKDGRQWKLHLGHVGLGGIQKGVVYVTSSDRSGEPIAIRGTELDHLFKSAAQLRERTLLSASPFNVKYIRLDETGKQTVVLEEQAPQKWRFQKPPLGEADFEGEAAPAGRDDTKVTGINGLLAAISKIKVEADADFVEADATDLGKYGLEETSPATLRIEIERKPTDITGPDAEKVQAVLLIGKKNDKGDKYYARLADDRAVVLVSAANIDAIAKVAAEPAILRNRDLVRFRPNEVDAIDIKNASGLIQIRGEPARRKLLIADAKPRNADDKAVEDLLKALSQPRQVQSFPDPAKDQEYGFDKPDAPAVSIWVDGLTKDENKEVKADEPKSADSDQKLKDPDKPTYRLTFGMEDKDTVYVRRESGGDKTIVAAPKSLLAKINQGALAYYDRVVPSFSSSADVSKIILDRGGEIVEVEKEDGAWKLKQPAELAGRTADKQKVETILATLRGLKPERFEAQGQVDLDKYGLKTPALKATIKIKGTDDKTEDWTYLFGGKTGDEKGIYGKKENADLVFVASPNVADVLRGDLEDPTVFQFDAGKVKELKLSGWKQLTGSTYVLHLERKNANSWVAKLPPDFEPNRVQTEEFAAALAHLKADKFVVKKGGPQPEHKLDPKEANLQIEILIDGQKDPLTLTVGDLSAKDKAYFAQSSNLPGNVFLLSEEPAAGASLNWKEIVKTPKYFSK